MIVSALVLCLLVAPLAAEAQQQGKMYRIGQLSSLEAPGPNHVAFQEKLRELGWVEGRNIIIENRFAGLDPKRLAAFAAQLVDLRVDLIMASGGTESVQAAKNATKTIPIVFTLADDPMRVGIVSSMSRPGANITGLSSINTELDAKRLALLKEALPQLKQVGILRSPVDPSGPAVLKATEAAARSLGVQLQVFDVRRPKDVDDAFNTAKKRGVGAVMVPGIPSLSGYQHQIADLAARTRLPVISPWKQGPQFGGLMSYGADAPEMFRRAAVYADKILKGAKPGDLPIEQPTKFELVINLKTAKALGLTIPPSLLGAGGRGHSVMERRTFLAGTGAVFLAAPLTAEAQQAARVARIGWLLTGSLESPETRLLRDAFREGLRERGYVEGQNVVIEYRSADGKIERFPRLASELARLKLDLIVAANTPAARAVQQATTTTPIVVPVMGDPVGDGLVASLARPGGNITGLTFLGPELVPKRVGLLKEALPKVSRVAALWHPGGYSERTTRDMLKETEAAARTLGVQLQLVGVQGPDEFDRAFSTMTRERADALIVFPSPMLFNERRRIVDLAVQHRLPSISVARQFVELGGLLSYGASITDLNRRAATYVDRILKGAKPGDLPVEQPTKFELVINLKTAKALGLTIPPSVLQRADEIIQ